MKQPAACRGRRAGRGFSYVEVLTAVVLLAVAAAPAMDALRAGLAKASFAPGHAARQFAVRAKLEQVLAEPYHDLAAAASDPSAIGPSAVYSDAVGSSDRRVVSIAPVDADDADGDGDRFTGTDDGLLWIRVAIEGQAIALETLTAEVGE